MNGTPVIRTTGFAGPNVHADARFPVNNRGELPRVPFSLVVNLAP
jgi:hypothetical protein